MLDRRNKRCLAGIHGCLKNLLAHDRQNFYFGDEVVHKSGILQSAIERTIGMPALHAQKGPSRLPSAFATSACSICSDCKGIERAAKPRIYQVSPPSLDRKVQVESAAKSRYCPVLPTAMTIPGTEA